MLLPEHLTTMLYFQLVIMAGTVMLAYYFEYTDTFSVHVQGFFCYDSAYTKPFLGPERASAVPPALLYTLVAGVPTLVITMTEAVVFLMLYTSKEPDSQRRTIVTGDCCYLNPVVRRIFRFLGVYVFGLFTTDIFVNAGQVVTGNLAPHFLTVCKPNYTALGCLQALRYISHQEACTGNEDDILRARKTFPSKEAALSVYAALYLAMYITCSVRARGTRLAKPVMALGLMCLAFLAGLNRVAEYRNHWSDVIAGFIIGVAIATFLVVCVVHNFEGTVLLSEDPQQDAVSSDDVMSMAQVESPLEKYITSQNHIAFDEVT
ncbi:phospholipid phosphatase-related protein type 5 isoform X1 [Brachyhypopomus gauderio]|uniref:phospholipid phosphatase-related protein type 5 isoform X1 n=1 Tax=Brachyhypopomus gauderio TaxID=698409 RepID=UPI004042A6BB